MVVDLAYHLNSLGFLALEDGVHNGNYWISDLIAGLKWIEKYIAAFGGDPTKIIIYGESAGAQSVQALLRSVLYLDNLWMNYCDGLGGFTSLHLKLMTFQL